MNWKQIQKNTRVQNEGVYTDWKQQISDDCFNQCIYCSIHENPWGGIDHYHIEHFRPKSKFEELEHIITNLYHACPICNKFKSDDWPNENDDLNKVCYPDPSDYNYTDLFEFDNKTHTLVGKYKSSTYLINRLYLNRPQLTYERREQFLKIKAEALINDAKELIDLIDDVGLIKDAFRTIANLSQHLHIRGNIPPYKLVEIRKIK
ncbi:HNH endonuclease [Ferruginibacter sp.]|nr:hypothetical protein [Ferruginibacter sp.]